MTLPQTNQKQQTDKLPQTEDNIDDKQHLVLVDLVSKLIQLLILFLSNLFKRLKVE